MHATNLCANGGQADSARRRRAAAWRSLGIAAALGVALVAMPSPAAAAVDPDGETVVFDIVHGCAPAAARAATTADGLRFDAFGRHFDLTLEPNGKLVAAGVDAVLVDDAGEHHAALPETWIGRGGDGSEARLVVSGSEARGYVQTPDGTFVFEPDASSGAPTGSHVVHRASDLLAAGGPIGCAADDSSPAAPVAPSVSARAVRASIGANPLHVLEVSVVVDAATARSRGANTVESVLALFNEVDGIFRSELGITLQIAAFVVYESETAQPFTATTSSLGLLMQVSSARRSLPLLGAGGITHLITGASLSDANGIGWVAGACDAYAGASLSEVAAAPSYLDAVLVAHEIGHNVGAYHDGPAGSGCENTPPGFIMWPVLSGNAVGGFSACSEAHIAGWLPTAACLAAVVAPGCGNGVVDAGEECDDNSGCCRSDCAFKAPGLPCGDSGDVCYDAVCNGLGVCASVPNDAPCTADDACVAAQCSGGVCIPSEVPKSLDAARAMFRVDLIGNVTSARLSGSASMETAGGDPTVSGLEMHVKVGGVAAWDEFVPAANWVRKGNGKYQYKAPSATPGHLRLAKVRFDQVMRRAFFQMDAANPGVAVPPGPSSIFLLAGDRVDGQCATADVGNCTRRGRSALCE